MKTTFTQAAKKLSYALMSHQARTEADWVVDVVRHTKWGDGKLRFTAGRHPNPNIKAKFYDVRSLEPRNHDAVINRIFRDAVAFVRALARYQVLHEQWLEAQDKKQCYEENEQC